MADRISFWRRQLTGEPTALQYTFDLLFGAILPIICLAADPIVFYAGPLREAMLADYALFAYVLTGVQILTLTTGFVMGGRLGGAGPWLAGTLATGAIFAGVLGVAILPLSMIGLLLVIGILGFTPFLTSFVFLRNAVRAYAKTRPQMRPAAKHVLLTVGLLSALLPAVGVDRYAHHSIKTLLDHPEKPNSFAETFVSPRRIVEAYVNSPDGPHRDALAALHKRLTGVGIERAVEIHND